MHHVRSLAKTPGFSLVVIFTMSLGIAASTALFSVVDSVLLQPLAFRDPGSVVAIHTLWQAKGRTSTRITGGDFVDLRSAVHSFSAMALYTGGEIGVRLGDHARFARTFLADPAFFRVLDVKPAMGRLPEERDADRTAILTTSFALANWGDPANAIGQFLTIDNKSYQVIGLVDDRFAFPERAQLWITGPLLPENRNHTAFNYYAIARLRPGVDRRQAQAELSTVSARLAHAEPESNKGKTFGILSIKDDLTGSVRTSLLFLFGAAGLLLFISCANVANLMLMRVAGRSREIAVRISLGSSTAGIARMLLGEGTVLGCVAGALGLLLAYISVRAVSVAIPATVPRAAEVVHMHAVVLLFAVAVSASP
jgi:putative ABC transport system permease protein